MELLGTLVADVRSAYAPFPDARRGDVRYSMADIGMSAFSLFFHAIGVFPGSPAQPGGGACWRRLRGSAGGCQGSRISNEGQDFGEVVVVPCGSLELSPE